MTFVTYYYDTQCGHNINTQEECKDKQHKNSKK